MSHPSCSRARAHHGFTLIEVIGALVIFSVGVLMVMQVSSALGTQMRNAGARSRIAVAAGEVLDSLEALPPSSLAGGTTVDTLVAEGVQYERSTVVTPLTGVLTRIDVSIAPIDGGGPSHSVTSYTSEPW